MPEITGPYTPIDHGDYTEYVVDAGGRINVEMGDGDRFGEAHINIENSGAGARIIGYSSSVTNREYLVENVAVTGIQAKGRGFLLMPSTNDEAVFRNCWFGGGAEWTGSQYDNPGGAWHAPTMTGHITYDRCYMGVSNHPESSPHGFTDNGWYCSAPFDNNGTQGTVTWRNCWGSNHNATYRGGHGDRVINCYAAGQVRGIWLLGNAAPGSMIVEDSVLNDVGQEGRSIYYAMVNSSGTTIEISGSSYGDVGINGNLIDAGGNDRNPSHYVPEGCPTTPEQAYLGEGGGGDPTPPPDPTEPFDDPVCVRWWAEGEHSPQ